MTTSRSLPRLAALAVTAILMLSACTGGTDSKYYKYTSATTVGKLIPVADRKPANDFSGALIDGGTMKLSQTRGKVVIVNFWASWCGPCQVETPQLETYYQQMKSKNVTVLGIDTKDAKANAKYFISQHKISFPMIYDQQGQTALELGNIPANLPFSVIVDKTGRVAAVYLHPVTQKDLQRPVSTLRAET